MTKIYIGQKFSTPMQGVQCALFYMTPESCLHVFSLLILFSIFSKSGDKVFLFPFSSMRWSTHARTKTAIGLVVVLLVSVWKTEAASCIWIRKGLFTITPLLCINTNGTDQKLHGLETPGPTLHFCFIFLTNNTALTAQKEF